MFSRIAVIIFTGFILPGCNETGKYYGENRKDKAESVVSKTDSSVSRIHPVEQISNENDLQLFCNNEITPYCVLLPLREFKEDYSNGPAIKARHKFVLKHDSTAFTSIEVQAFTIDKQHNYNTALFLSGIKEMLKKEV